MTITPKQFYVARRHPGMSAEEFRANWRGHGELAMRQPLWDNIFRYTQGDAIALEPDVASRVPGLDPTADGVSTIWFHDFDALMAIPAAPEHDILLRDEERIFAEMVADVSMFTQEEIVHDDGTVACKLVLFLRRAPGLSAAEFEGAWREHAESLAGLEDLRGHVAAYRLNHDRPLPGATGGTSPPSSLAAYDGVAEIGFADVEGLVAAVREPQFQELVRGLDELTSGVRSLATSELLLDQK